MNDKYLHMVSLARDLLLMSAREHELPRHTRDICHNIGRDMLQWVRDTELVADSDAST